MTAIVKVKEELISFSRLSSFLQVIGGSFFLAICSQLSIPLFFTPVPISMQTFAVLLIGGFLGSKKGALAVALYLFEGVIGLPFFSGGHAGVACLLSPSGGYLLGFLVAAFVIGMMVEKGKTLRPKLRKS